MSENCKSLVLQDKCNIEILLSPHVFLIVDICNSYTMACPPLRGDNPRALASGLSYVQVDKHGITILYHLHHEIFPVNSVT